MKKIILGFFLGAITFGSIGIYAANYLAADVTYKSNNEDWNVSNVNEALDRLYEISNSNDIVLADTAVYADGNNKFTYNVEDDGTYLISFASSKAKLNCSDTTTSISVTGYETLDVLYDKTTDTGWSYDGSSQLHLYLAKVTMKSGNVLSINTSIGNGYSLGKIVLIKM